MFLSKVDTGSGLLLSSTSFSTGSPLTPALGFLPVDLAVMTPSGPSLPYTLTDTPYWLHLLNIPSTELTLSEIILIVIPGF